jgi:hypothetical protein
MKKMPRSLDLGVVFTGDASSVINAANAVRTALASLNTSVSTMGGAMRGVATAFSSGGSALSSFQTYLGNLTDRLKGQPGLLKNATAAANQLGEKYGTSKLAMENWGKALDAQVGKVQAIGNQITNLGKNGDAWMNTVNMMSRTERAMAKDRGVTAEALRATGKELNASSSIHSEYQRVLAKSVDRSRAFKNALETGTRINTDAAGFRQYATELTKFDELNSVVYKVQML